MKSTEIITNKPLNKLTDEELDTLLWNKLDELKETDPDLYEHYLIRILKVHMELFKEGVNALIKKGGWNGSKLNDNKKAPKTMPAKDGQRGLTNYNGLNITTL